MSGINRAMRRSIMRAKKQAGDRNRLSTHKMKTHMGMTETKPQRIDRLRAKKQELFDAIDLLKNIPHNVRNWRHKVGRLQDELGRVNTKLMELEEAAYVRKEEATAKAS